MDKESIDASVGLAFGLTLFERYRKTGLLQAELQRIPKYRGNCKGYLHLIEGKVVSSYLEDRQGERHPMSREQLIQLDQDKGPFEWSLTTAPLPAPQAGTYLHGTTSGPIPQRIAAIDMEKLQGWSTMQKMMLSMILEAIDGRHNIEEIKAAVPLAPGIVEEGLHILLALKVISISS